MRFDTRILLRGGVFAVLLTGAACSNRGGDSPAAEISEPAAAVPVMKTVNSPEQLSIDQQIAGAVADLASRANLAPDAVTVKQARSVNWGSGALGCPEPGMNYTQAIEPGLLVMLEADGRIYRYHGKAGMALFYCPDERARAPAYGIGEEVM